MYKLTEQCSDSDFNLCLQVQTSFLPLRSSSCSETSIMKCIFKSSPDRVFLDRFIKYIYVETEQSHHHGVDCGDSP